VLNVLRSRWKQGHRTIGFPKPPSTLPDRFRGLPVFDPARCPQDCRACVDACPTGAICRAGEAPSLQFDLGRCLFCTDCQETCPQPNLRSSDDYRLATRTRADLVLRGQDYQRAAPLEGKIRRLLGRSLRLRQVSAGGCNACEADTNVLGTVGFDLGRFGIQFVASPRHADGLLITGPVTENMRLALQKTYDATPSPKVVVAVGACAISGGMFADHPETHGGADSIVPVDLYVPGCPPHPLTILDGLLRLIGQIR
jgi:Ni,Fe-hydrogenase III small subunit